MSTGLMFVFLNRRLVVKENSEQCPLQFPGAQSDVFQWLFVKNIIGKAVSNQNILDIYIQEAGTS